MPPLKSIAVPVKPPKASHGKRKKTANGMAELAHVPTPVEIRRAPVPVMAHPTHRYRVGERLMMTNGGRTFSRVAAGCIVVARLPHEGRGHLLYRVRSETEQYERVVAEMDLSRAEDDGP
jgi:hypothetical protein